MRTPEIADLICLKFEPSIKRSPPRGLLVIQNPNKWNPTYMSHQKLN